ncbi:MAG: IS1380 family transposase [Actinomycetota bacterium]|nr:IS1380 family transposase [Actinomycetota bacterium]
MEGTRQVKTIAKKRAKVVLGAPDGRITPRGGLHLVAKLDKLLGITATIDNGDLAFKQRKRGLMLGSVMVSLAETMLAGGDFLCDLDHQREDVAGLRLRAVPDVPASTTVIGLGQRFDEKARVHVERANAKLVKGTFSLLPEKRRASLIAQRPSIDLDPTDTEVYGRMKEGSDFNYQGQRVYRPHPAVWAEAGWVLAADFGSGKSDPRPQAPALLARALAALPAGLLRPIVRADSGFFDAKLATAALSLNCDYAVAVKRSDAVWRAERKIPTGDWQRAKGMDAEVAECDYVPTNWPEGSRTLCRRVRVNALTLSRDPRSRRRRTIDPAQLTLLESGEAATAYAYSFIITNLAGDVVDIEAWFRMRALVEEKIKDSKLGLAMRHMPSGYESVNVMWMWAALLGLNISSWLQVLTGHDETDGRAHGKRLRRELVCVAARVTNHAGRFEVHTSREDHHGLFGDAWRTLDVLLAGTSP